MRVYDPPAGWRYGFPKAYEPLPNETLEETLRRDGYPQKEIDNGGAKHCRFWTTKEAEFCKVCGAGIGKWHRQDEGTCPKCSTD